MITTIICDIGGVLITSAEKVTPYILSQMFEISPETAINAYNQAVSDLQRGKMGVGDLANNISRQYCPKYEIRNFHSAYIDLYEKQAVIDADMMQLLEILHPKYRLAAFSNMLDLHAQCNRGRGLFRLFHNVYISSVTGFAKPNVEAFNYVINDMQLIPGDCLFIDNQKENTDMAASLGMNVYLFDTVQKLKGFLDKNGIV